MKKFDKKLSDYYSKDERFLMKPQVTDDDKIEFYKHQMNWLDNHKDWEWIKEDYPHKMSLYTGEDYYDPIIVLEFDKEMDHKDFFLMRGFLFNYLESIRGTVSNWGICRSNQVYESFKNVLEIHPSLKDEYKFGTIFEKVQKEQRELFFKKMDLEKEYDKINDQYLCLSKYYDIFNYDRMKLDLKKDTSRIGKLKRKYKVV